MKYKKIKVLHVLYQSYPMISGSSIRSLDLINSQKKIGLQPTVVTSPFQNGFSGKYYDIINNVKYYRTYVNNESELASEKKKSLWIRLRKIFRIIPFTLRLYLIAKKEKPDIIHSHAMFFCAIPGKIVAKLIGAKFVYEVRSLWEERGTKNKLYKKVLKSIEECSLKLSKKFIVINYNLKRYFESRGFAKEDIFVVPNAINLDRITGNDNVTFKNKTSEGVVFGYIGTVSPIEGLDLIIKTFSSLKSEGFDNKFLIYGHGIDEKRLKKLINEYGVEDQIKFKGKFEPEKINQVYAEVDVVINPRVKSRITDSVTPIKPLEAQSYKKLFIGSNVGGISELIEDNHTGLLFESGSVEDLKNKIQWVLDSRNLDKVLSIINRGYRSIVELKNWNKNCHMYISIYNDI